MPSSPRPPRPTLPSSRRPPTGPTQARPQPRPSNPPLNNNKSFYENIMGRPMATTDAEKDQRYVDYGGYAVNYDGIARRQLEREMANLPPAGAPPAAPRPRGGGGGYGGGGGGGVKEKDPAEHFGSYYKKVMEALAGMKPYEDTLTPMVNTAVDADLARVGTEFGKVGKAASDPYANFAPQAAQIDPQTAAMMEAQGMGGEASRAQQMAAQQDLQGMVDLWTNYGKAQSSDMQASNARFNSGVESDQAGVAADLQAARSALLARAAETTKAEQEKRDVEKRNAILQLLSAGFGAGADMSDYDLGGLF